MPDRDHAGHRVLRQGGLPQLHPAQLWLRLVSRGRGGDRYARAPRAQDGRVNTADREDAEVKKNGRILLALLLASLSVPAGALDLAGYRLVDLGHAYGEDTLYWPSRPAAH